MTSSVNRILKLILPSVIYAPTRNWAIRLLTWRRLMRDVRGASIRDGFWLWLSFLASPVTAAFGLSQWRDPLLLHDIVAEVAGVGRFRLRAATDDIWHVAPFRERAVLECIRTRLRPGDYFVDAGANIGFYTIVGANAVGASGSVLAIEMLKTTAHILRDHIALNGVANVRVLERALSSRDDEIIIASMPPGSFGQASIANTWESERFEVLSMSLDSVLRDISSIRLIKIDIEGAEIQALGGAITVLDRVESIIFEHLDDRSSGILADFLISRGFYIEKLDGRNSLALRDIV